ncbi:MAG TPA: sulfotransferase [Steroidobacteraceae bacterium]|nr:sulfotransferase [Steroidobacteraceae bacterium]
MQSLIDAERRVRAALAARADVASLHDDLGMILARQGRHAEAIPAFERALQLDATLPHTRKRLADALAASGRGSEADQLYSQYFAQDPDRQAIASGAEHLQAGRKKEAAAAFEAVLRRNPDHVDALRMLALTLAGDATTADDAEALLRKVTALAPDHTAAWINLGTLLIEQKKWMQGVECFRTATRLEPANAAAWFGLANALAKATYPEESVAAYSRAVELDPGDANAQLGLAHVLKAVGRQDQAIAAYRAAIRLRPDFGEAYWSLANLKTFRFTAEEIAAMHAQLDTGTLAQSTAVHFCFALGKAYEDAGDHDSAWHWYHEGNTRKRPLVSHDPLVMEQRHAAIMSTFTAEFMRERAGQGYEAADPIFIVGLHRSGSTLIEQILASHSQVEGTAELSNLGMIAGTVGRYRADHVGFPEAARDLRPKDWRAYGRQYIEETRRHRLTDRPRFTDKMPSNFALIGFLHLILPNARVINASRHPLDSLLGNYKQLYGGGLDYSYDMEELADYYRNYHRMMQHWQAALPGKVLTVHYEDTVMDLESQVRRILGHCGLPFEESCLHYYRNPRAVKTASSEQVRRPIYTEGLGVWRRYEKHLDFWKTELADIIAALPERVRDAGLPPARQAQS